MIDYIWSLGGSRRIYLTFNNHCVLVFSPKDPQWYRTMVISYILIPTFSFNKQWASLPCDKLHVSNTILFLLCCQLPFHAGLSQRSGQSWEFVGKSHVTVPWSPRFRNVLRKKSQRPERLLKITPYCQIMSSRSGFCLKWKLKDNTSHLGPNVLGRNFKSSKPITNPLHNPSQPSVQVAPVRPNHQSSYYFNCILSRYCARPWSCRCR